jgi:hypothetical protein
MSQSNMTKLTRMALSLEKSAEGAKTPVDAMRMRGLAEVLKHPSA